MTFRFLRSVLFCLVAAATVATLGQSCSKGGGASPNPSNTMTLKAGDTAWAATSVWASDSAGIMWVLGLKYNNVDSGIVILAFPDDLTPGKTFTISTTTSDSLLMVYSSDLSNEEYEWVSDGATASMTGTVTITSINYTSNTISGTFSGNFENASNQSTLVNINSGSFNMDFTPGASPQIPSGL